MPPDYFDAHFEEPGWEHRSLTAVTPPAWATMSCAARWEFLVWMLAALLAEAPRPGPCELVASPAAIVGAPPGVSIRLWWPPAAPSPLEPSCAPPSSS